METRLSGPSIILASCCTEAPCLWLIGWKGIERTSLSKSKAEAGILNTSILSSSPNICYISFLPTQTIYISCALYFLIRIATASIQREHTMVRILHALDILRIVPLVLLTSLPTVFHQQWKQYAMKCSDEIKFKTMLRWINYSPIIHQLFTWALKTIGINLQAFYNSHMMPFKCFCYIKGKNRSIRIQCLEDHHPSWVENGHF